MKIAEYLKQRRLEKGFTEVELSELVGLSVSSIGDLELYEDEIDVLSAFDLKRLCAALDINPADILRAIISDLKDLPLSDLIKSRREEKKYTIDELSDRIGWDRKLIDVIENSGDLNEVSVDALERMAMELDLPLSLIFEKL